MNEGSLTLQEVLAKYLREMVLPTHWIP